jgi:hypothetical protein
MKKLMLFFVIASLCFSCGQSPQKKAEEGVKNYLKENLNDWDSYENVSFSNFVVINPNAEIKDSIPDSLNIEVDTTSINPDMSLEDMEKSFAKHNEFLRKSKQLEALIEKRIEQKTAYSITHKYRAKNKLGAIILDEQTYILDKYFKVIK